MRLYFDRVYNPLYDLTIAQMGPYSELQRACLAQLSFGDGDTVLCVGAGTGNEVAAILQRNPRVRIVAVDTSPRALRSASVKGRRLGGFVDTRRMDAHRLAFPDDTFDQVVSIHLMDFLDNPVRATAEMVRVLKPGGQFVATFPAGPDSPRLLRDVWRHAGHSLRLGRYGAAVREMVGSLGAAVLYLPLALTTVPRRRFFSRPVLEEMLGRLPLGGWRIGEDKAYRDFIVCGRKQET